MKRSVPLACLAVLLVCTAWIGGHYLRGARFVVQAAGITGWPNTAATWQNRAFTTRDLQVATRYGPTPARLYLPEGPFRRTVVLVPGVHGAGIDEPRLVGFAKHLAEAGLAVLTPELVDLKRYQITTRGSDVIEDSAQWVSRQEGLAPDGRVGLMGISFGGGLSMVAAGRPGVRDRIAFVFSFGGYADFSRVLRYLCTGRQPDGSYRAPHDYGVVIILLDAADLLVPAEQVEGLRAAIRLFLNASHIDMFDHARAAPEFERAKTAARALPEPAATLMRYVNTRDVKALGARLLPIVSADASDLALSPERSPAPAAPVYLLHGADDNVIPAAESTLLARHLQGITEVHTLITSLITHAEIDRPARVGEVLSLVRFWTGVLAE